MDAESGRCDACGAPLDRGASSGGSLGRVVHVVVGILGGLALLYVGLQLAIDRDGDPVQAIAGLVVGCLCICLGVLAIALVIPRPGRGRRSPDA